MRIDVEIIIASMLILLFTNLILTFRLIINKLKRDDKNERRSALKQKLISGWVNNGYVSEIAKYFDILSQSRRLMKLDEVMEGDVAKRLENKKIIRKYTCNLKSLSKLKRIQAAVNISVLSTPETAKKLENALMTEKKRQVKLYLANALTDIGNPQSVPVLIESLIGEHKWYREKVNMLIGDFGYCAYEYISNYLDDNRIEIIDFIIDFASVNPTSELKEYIFEKIDNYDNDSKQLVAAVKSYVEINNNKDENIRDEYGCFYEWFNYWDITSQTKDSDYLGLICFYKKIIIKAMETAQKYYFTDFTDDKYINHKNNLIRKYAVETLSKIKNVDNVYKLCDLMYDEEVSDSARTAIAKLISNYPEFIDEVSELLMIKRKKNVRQMLADALSSKIEYFIMKLNTNENKQAKRVIEQILLLGKINDFIGFINNNKDIDIENKLIKMLTNVLRQKPEYTEEFSLYLNERALAKAGLKKKQKPKKKKEYTAKPNLIKNLIYILVVAVLLFPIVHFVKYFDNIHIWSFTKHLKVFVIDFNYYLVYYSLTINVIYLILIVLSRLNVKRQSELWNVKNDSMLFRKRMLPGISVIAPAYNEEKIIIESTNSLLNLKYPDYNLIIVNDGSNDNTLSVLLEYYELERVDYSYDEKIPVAQIRGIYRNPSYPKLFVVDTENAGKADSLNAGILISNKEYYCCIDSDSLLESDALLKLASQTLDEDVETPALGGNVFPINGCRVERGHIADKRIPDNAVAKLQTIEYIRAFMSGRLGWAYINNLLIISGAFGIFRKERVIGIGGYLTKSSRYGSDTVGEDMELVVRIAYLMHKQRKKYKINYCYNANCWTEVPEKLGQLKRQRVRWFRGLVETLHFHKATIFNPRYGSMGLISMPYFFVFEMVGPLIEIQGYIMVLLAFILGLLSADIALLLFFASVMLGIFVSIVSLMISETKNSYYNYIDLLKLIGIAIVENFGPRQLFSFWRVLGFFKMFAKEHSWGRQERKGFVQK